MTLDEFAAITKRVIARDGFDEFQPTACFPSRREVKTLAGFPADIEPETPVLEWAAKSAGDAEEFLVAFKTDDGHFRVVRRVGTDSDAKTYAVA
jgi:hypothetical protein